MLSPLLRLSALNLKEAVAATATPVVDESAGVSLKESYAKIGWK